MINCNVRRNPEQGTGKTKIGRSKPNFGGHLSSLLPEKEFQKTESRFLQAAV
jgi:hypothetical protein